MTEAAESRSQNLPALIQAQYSSLVALARQIHSREPNGNSLSPTVLVHEAFVRLVDQPGVSGRGKTFFRACFAQECRRVLVDHARRRNALRRGGGRKRESLDDQPGNVAVGGIDVVELNDAIEALAKRNPRMAHIADMRLFCEMSIAECADALGVAPRTIDKDWAFARSWLQRELD